MVFLQSYMTMPGGRLWETENNRTCQISGLRSGCDLIRNFKYWSLTGESLKQYLTKKQNGSFQSGRLLSESFKTVSNFSSLCATLTFNHFS